MQPGESIVQKLQVYLLLLSFAVCLLGIGVLRWNRDPTPPGLSKAPTAAAKLKALVTTSSCSGDMSDFARREQCEQSRR